MLMCSIFSKAAINVSYQNESNVAIYIFKGKIVNMLPIVYVILEILISSNECVCNIRTIDNFFV